MMTPSRLISLLLLVSVMLFDQVSKYVVVQYFPQLVILNTKGMFGLLPVWTAGLAFVPVVWLYGTQKQYRVELSAVLGAGISNFLDRILYGGVVDFLRIPFIPTFNLADSIITLAFFVLIVQSIGKDYGKN